MDKETKGRRVDKETKNFVQILPAVWKAEKREPEGGSSGEEVMVC